MIGRELWPLWSCYCCGAVTVADLLPSVTGVELLPLWNCYRCGAVTVVELLPVWICYQRRTVTIVELLLVTGDRCGRWPHYQIWLLTRPAVTSYSITGRTFLHSPALNNYALTCGFNYVNNYIGLFNSHKPIFGFNCPIRMSVSTSWRCQFSIFLEKYIFINLLERNII